MAKQLQEAGKLAAGGGGSKFSVTILEGDIQGSSAYYPASVVERDGPKAFPKGTKMFIDHQSFSQFIENPAGSLTNLAGVLETTPVYDPARKALVAEAAVFSQWAPLLTELAPHIGLSIRAAAVTESQVINGAPTEVATELISGLSVDFVTATASGGKINSVLESRPELLPPGARLVKESQSPNERKPTVELTEEAAKVLTESIAALTTALTTKPVDPPAPPMDPRKLILEASAKLSESGLPQAAFARVLAMVSESVTLDDAITAEKAYLAEVAPSATPDSGTGGSFLGKGTIPAPKENPWEMFFGSTQVAENDSRLLAALGANIGKD